MPNTSDDTVDVSGKKESKPKLTIKGWRLFRLAIACYSPAFILVILSFIFVPRSKFFSRENPSVTLTDQQIEEKVTEVLDREIDAALDKRQQDLEEAVTQQQAITNDADSILLKGYIDGQVREEVQIQAERAAKDEIAQAKTEIETLKVNWTADLFNQIAFAVIFTVASIFAAFAVKDVLTEILKEQEKDRIRRDLKKELEGYVTDDLLTNQVRTQTLRIENNLEGIESYTYWLEHELLIEKIIQMLGDIKPPAASDTQEDVSNDDDEAEQEALRGLEKLIERYQQTLTKVSGKFLRPEVKLLQDAENEILKYKIEHCRLTPTSRTKILQKLKYAERDSERIIATLETTHETISQRVDNIFEVQITLLITTLSKLPIQNPGLIERLKKAIYSGVQEDLEEESSKFLAEVPNPKRPSERKRKRENNSND